MSKHGNGMTLGSFVLLFKKKTTTKKLLLHLEQAFREKDLYGLLQDGQQTSMMDSDPPLQEREHVLHLTKTHTHTHTQHVKESRLPRRNRRVGRAKWGKMEK